MFVINLSFFEIRFASAPVCTTYLVIVSEHVTCFADVLYQVLTSKKLIIFLANLGYLSKLYFKLRDNKEISKENCSGNL